MIKKIVLLVVSTLALVAGDYTLDTGKSEAYYEARKDQFFSTYTILGVNHGLTGSLVELPSGYRGELSVDVFSFDSDDTRRDGNVEEHLNGETYKFVTYKYALYDNEASGTMTINGVSKEISFPVTMQEKDGKLFVEGNISIKYSDFGMETPSNLILSAYDDLIIGAKLYFNK